MVAKSASASTPPPPASSTLKQQRFKGVRMRSWGKWVSEIRLPNTRARLWLGSYTTPEQAARAFDVAVVCLRGRSATLNFPNSPPSYAPLGLPHHQIQELAAAAAAAASSSPSPRSCELRARPNSSESETATITSSSDSDESEAATLSSSPGSEESGAATIASSSSSCCCSPAFDDSATFAGLLELDEENEQSSPADASLQEQALNLASEWDELLWGFTMTAYPTAWEESLLLLPSLPVEDDLPTIVEPSLWSL